MALPSLLSEEELKPWILRRLGAPYVKVFLDEPHLEDCIEEARRWFASRKGIKKRKYIYVNSGQTEYQLEEDIDKVLDVSFNIPPLDISTVFAPFLLPDQQLPYNVFANPEGGGIYSNYAQTLQYVETAKRILGAENEWRQEGHLLYLIPAPKGAGTISIEYKPSSFVITELEERDHDLLKRYALALAKIDLGEILSRYPGGFPSAQGNVALNGPQLLQEGQQESAALTEELMQSAYPMGFLTG